MHTPRAAALLALALAACSADPAPPRAAPSSATTRPTAPATGAPAAPPTASPTFEVVVEREFAHFSTPTRNIGCYVSQEAVGCGIYEYSWPLPSKPADCDADWAPGLSIARDGAVEFGHCASDTVMGAERILPYGTEVRVSGFRCASEQRGVTCSHDATRHGFFLSRTRYTVF